MTSVSLCLIACDEERMLPGCLASVQGLADELIVVDTGSRDRTREVARQAGARVFDFDWCNDFSAARNAAVSQATGDWVLMLDADERITSDGVRRLREVIDDGAVHGALLPLINAARLDIDPEQAVQDAMSHEAPILVARLFRRGPRLRWSGRIHEQPSEWLSEHQDELAAVAAPIVHYGYVDEIEQARSKLERNGELLRLQLAEQPRTVDFAYGASTLRRLGERDRARELVELGWSRLQDTDQPSAAGAHLLALERAQQQLGRGEVAAAEQTVDWVRARFGDHPNLDYLDGRRLELTAPIAGPRRPDILQAAGGHYVAALARADELSTVPVLAGASSWRSRARLAAVLLGLGDFRRALVGARAVPPGCEASEDARLIEAEALAGLGRFDEARHVLAGLPQSIDKGVIEAALTLATGCEDLPSDALSAQGKPRLAHRVAVLDTLRRRGTDGARPIFVGGAGRSGTTLMRAMLHAHRGLHAPPELKWTPAVALLYEDWHVCLRPVLADAQIADDTPRRAVRALLDTFFQRVAPAGSRLVEKTPHNLCYVAALADLYPRARFVHMVRDGRAVAASRVRQQWFDPRTGKRPEHDEEPVAAAGYWASVQHQVRRGLPFALGRVLEVRYEDLVVDPESVMRRVLAFLGEEWDPAVLEHHRSDVALPEREPSSAAVAKPINRAAVRAWRQELDDETIRAIEAEYGDLLDDHGYERVFPAQGAA